MKQTVTYNIFKNEFFASGRQNEFPEGLKCLFEYLEDYEESTGSEVELDVIALCCDFSEMKLSEALKEYGMDDLDELRDNTTVIMVDDEQDEDPTIIVQAF